jgi:PAS domain S-box-containing protein
MTIGFDRSGSAASFEAADYEDLQDFFENSAVGMHVAAADGTILRANRASYEPLGYTAQEYVGADMRAFFADKDAGSALLERLLCGQSAEDEPVQLLRKDGSLRPVRVDASALFRDGAFVHARCLVRDDAERVRAESALRANEQTSGAIADLLPVLISYVDKDWRYVYNNATYEDWFGHSRADVTGRTMQEVLGEEACSVLRPYVDAALAGERVTYDSQVPYRDGGHRWVRATYVPHRTPQGVQGFVAIVEDISERVLARQAARESEQRYALATRATRDAVWDWDLPNDSTSWSPALTSEFGWAPDEMRTSEPWWYDRIHADEASRVRASIQAAIDGQSTHWEEEYRFQHADGSWRTVHDRGFIVRDDSGKALRMVGSISDVTERRLAEEELRASEERYRTLAEALPSYIGQFDDVPRTSTIDGSS